MAEHLPAIVGDTPEAVAYPLLLGIADHEGKQVAYGLAKADEEWLLSTYARCLQATRMARPL